MAHRIHRWQAVAVALWVLAGCKVATEGAPCQTDASCPRGQRCGVDSRCSVKAAKCTECAEGETKCVGDGVATCTLAPGGVCPAFGESEKKTHMTCAYDDSTGRAGFVCDATDCKAEGVSCASDKVTWITCAVDAETGCLFSSTSQCTRGLCGQALMSCVCPAAGDTFYVDPVAGSADDVVTPPTGVESPANCRFKTLGQALKEANARAAKGEAATVKVSATGGMPPYTLSEASIELQPGVTLTSDAQTDPDGPPADLPYVLEVSGAPGVTLHEGATFSGLELQPAADAIVTDAIVTKCDVPDEDNPAKVKDAIVLGTLKKDAGPDVTVRFGNGVHQKGGCPIDIERTLLDGNGIGVSSCCGTLKIDHCDVNGGQTGISLDRTNVLGTALQATISNSRISGAADTGVQIMQVGAANSVTFTGNTITGNCAKTRYYLNAVWQRAGGILVFGAAPTIGSFASNKVAGNGWDQILVDVGDKSSLTMSGRSCPSANQFCPDSDSTRAGVGVYSAGAQVDARFNAWSSQQAAPPAQGTDYGGLNVNVGALTNEFCLNLESCNSYTSPVCP